MGTGGLFLRKLRAKVADEPTGFVWVEKAKLAGSGYPASRAQVEWLWKSGIRSMLSLTEEPLPAAWTTGLDLVLGHVPMDDHRPPSVKSMEEGVNFVAKQVADGRPVLVHCLAGEGRTGCVLAAYLIRTRKIGAEEAISTLRSVKPEFVELRQEQAVRDFASADSASKLG
ncbi:MAG: dual specificity protein phosphatase family protein [Nitrososphaerota archaeon]|nr:dual specificity protein phosphatase family protein [Nitrososphaerota archaeon]